MPRLFAALLSLARNAVPAFGVFARDWAPPHALLLYLGENIVLVLLGALTFRLLVPRSEDPGGTIGRFFLVAAPFTFGAALITTVVIAARAEYTVNVRELATAVSIMAAFQLVAFATGLRRLRGTPAAELEHMLSSVLLRVILLAFLVWVGMFLAFIVSTAFVIPFMIVKTLVDLRSLRPEALKRRLLAV